MNTTNELREVPASELSSVEGGAIWFPILMALVRFGFANASHNGSKVETKTLNAVKPSIL